MEATDIVSKNSIIVGLRGSLAHGMYVPSTDPDSIDDRDYMAVSVAPPSHYIGLEPWAPKGTIEHFVDDLDIVEYELLKFVGLLLKGNPNVIALLWLKQEHYLKITPGGMALIQHRDSFLSKDMFASFMGYANSQMQKMGKFASRGFRGKKREELITRYGYDTKNAAHCLRLLRMCIETLKTGIVFVDRSDIDAAELLEVKRGGWTQDRVLKEAQKLEREAKDAYSTSKLPALPDRKIANELCQVIIKDTWEMTRP